MPPLLFDPAALVARAERAARLWPSGAAAHEHAAALLAERLEDVPRDFPRLAVIGAGGGAYAAALRGRAGQAETVQLEAQPALARLAATGAPWAATLTGPIQALDEGRFDLIVSGLSLHREDDPVGALAQMRRALVPDGLMLAALPAGRCLHELRAALAEAEAAVEGGLSPRVTPMADLRDLGALLQRAGFAMPVADLERLTLTYADPLALMRELRAHGEANALAERRRTPLRRATLAAACATYAAAFPAEGGRVRATVEVAVLTGWAPGPGQPVPKRPGSAVARLADALGTQEKKL
jgi:SAM-dependent methyltransferase